MFEMSLTGADAVILVYAVDDWDTFEHLAVLRDKVINLRPDIPVEYQHTGDFHGDSQTSKD